MRREDQELLHKITVDIASSFIHAYAIVEASPRSVVHVTYRWRELDHVLLYVH